MPPGRRIAFAAVLALLGGFAEAGEGSSDAGALVLHVARVEDHAAVAGARVTLAGTSRGGRAVSLDVATDADGRAAFRDVPAGIAYRVEIAAQDLPPRVLRGLAVRRAIETRCLPVFVGPRVALEGRFVDESGLPVAGALVRAFAEPVVRQDGPRVWDAAESAEAEEAREPAPLGTATTDRQGRYRLADLPAGPITLRATAEGRRETVATVFLAPGGPAGGQPTRVLRGGADVAGVVVDGDGRPIAGARVFVESARGDSDERREVTTDAAGRFRATVADGGPFHVSARRAGTRFAVFRRFGVPPSEDLRVPLASNTTLDLTFLDHADGRALPGTSVEIQVRDAMNPNVRDVWTTSASASADESGRATLALPAGFVSSVVVTSPGHVGATIDNIWWIPDGDLEIVKALFEKRLDAGRPLALSLRLAGEVGGGGSAVEGRVVDPAGRSVAGAEVVGVSVGAVSPHRARTDADGRFRIAGAAEEVFVSAEGFAQRAEAREVPARDVGAPASEATFRLERAATVRGRVVDAEGRGVAGACVSILPRRSNDGSISTRHRGVFEALRDRWGTTSADGTYVLRDVVPLVSVPMDERDNEVKGAALTPGPATVVVRARGFADAVSTLFTYAGGAVTEAPTVSLSRGARWRGRVVDPAGRSVPGAELQIDAVGDGTSIAPISAGGAWRAAADGSFVVDALPLGTVKIVARAKGFAAGLRSMHVTGEGDLPSLDVVLRASKTIVGRVLDPTGKPIEGAKVFLDWSDRIPEHPAAGAPIPDATWDEMYSDAVATTTDATGRFALEGCPAGRVKLQFERKGFHVPNSQGTRGQAEVATDGSHPVFVLEAGAPPEDGR